MVVIRVLSNWVSGTPGYSSVEVQHLKERLCAKCAPTNPSKFYNEYINSFYVSNGKSLICSYIKLPSYFYHKPYKSDAKSLTTKSHTITAWLYSKPVRTAARDQEKINQKRQKMTRKCSYIKPNMESYWFSFNIMNFVAINMNFISSFRSKIKECLTFCTRKS